MILVTGSSGFVGSNLVKIFRKKHELLGVDLNESETTDLVCDIGSSDLLSILEEKKSNEITIINLAAARFDFGAKPSDYYYHNVTANQKFLETISSLNIKKFIHVSSVASIDGESIRYSNHLSCDDAYRSTKFLQEIQTISWCKQNNVKYVSLLPSAIFSSKERSDTNIGKLQKILKYLPFIPKIDTKKSLTYLPNLISYIDEATDEGFLSGRYLAIEKPVLSVSEMITLLSNKKLLTSGVPFLKEILIITSKILYVIGGFGRIDLKLTPNRVEKLFKETAYDNVNSDEIDIYSYEKSSQENLKKILENL